MKLTKINVTQSGSDLNSITCRIKSVGTLWKSTYDDRYNAATVEEQQARGQVSGNVLNGDLSNMGVTQLYPITFPAPAFTPTETNTTGTTQGRSQTTTHTNYEEHSVTEGTEKQFSTSWGNATAQDTIHSADLWFSYKLSNIGSDYAREICNLAVNIYIGDDSLPSGTYFPAKDLGGSGCFSNFQPDENHIYSFPSSSRIQLTLDQVKAIDLGKPVRFVIEDYSLGQDDFYTDDAVNSGLLLSIDDGIEDGDSGIDTYVLPIQGGETVLDVLASFFPHQTDATGTLSAIWTPEKHSMTPNWCDEPRQFTSILWCKHALSTSEWWNVYTQNLGSSSTSYQDAIVTQGSLALFTFNKDSDQDGYSDKLEEKLGTDPKDPVRFPAPELLVGLYQSQNANQVTSILSFLNTGIHDAFAVEAVMAAPDDLITITNNTIGGSGRVPAQKQIIAGSYVQIQEPLPLVWKQKGHANLVVGGYFTGAQDRDITLTVNCLTIGGCSVGSGAWTVNWADNRSGSGTLTFSSGYLSPTQVNLNQGIMVGMTTGTVQAGESLTIQARTPRDTFQYTINREPHTDPVVIVSYNDLQGAHRFVVPPAAMNLANPQTNLAPFADTMMKGLKVDMVSTAFFQEGLNTTHILLNNSSGQSFSDSHLLLNFVDLEGTVVYEAEAKQTVSSGPSVTSVSWNTSAFDPVYDPTQDYLVLAFWTDSQGNILDVVGRPLSSFLEDPKPNFVMADFDSAWDFGSVPQGMLLRRQFVFANTGPMPLLTYLSAPAEVAISQTGSREVGPSDTTSYEINLNTSDQPLGAYDKTITIRTSDPVNPEKTVHVIGTITAGTADTGVGTAQKPLDYTLTVPGSRIIKGEWYEFAHNLGTRSAVIAASKGL